MSSEDFFFLIHKIGVGESLELLKLATLDQWQYVLDVESWQGDRLALNRTGQWMSRLLAADPERFTNGSFLMGRGLPTIFFIEALRWK